MRNPDKIPAVQFNHEKLLRSFDEKPETLQTIMKQTGQEVPGHETVRNWLRKERRFITRPWLASVIVALLKSNRISLADLFHKVEQP